MLVLNTDEKAELENQDSGCQGAPQQCVSTAEVFRLGCPVGLKSDGALALPSGVRLAAGGWVRTLLPARA